MIKSKHRVATLVKTLIVEAIRPAEGNDIKYRVDVFAWSDHEYSCQVWCIDMYRVWPSFHTDLADEELMIIDDGNSWDQLRAATVDELLDRLFADMERQFGVKIERPGMRD
jgi:hypothetical protein